MRGPVGCLVAQEFIQIFMLARSKKMWIHKLSSESGTASAYTVLNSFDAKICAFPLVLAFCGLIVKHM